MLESRAECGGDDTKEHGWVKGCGRRWAGGLLKKKICFSEKLSQIFLLSMFTKL